MRAITASLAALAMTAAGCTVSVEPHGTATATATEAAVEQPRRPARPARSASSLRTFDRCQAFLDHVRREALRRVTPYGLPGVGGIAVHADVVTSRAVPGGTVGGSAATGGAATAGVAVPQIAAPEAGYSSTNVQEVGIDEPDVIKTDGRRILAIARGRLHWTRPGDRGEAAGSLDLPQGEHRLLLAGDRALVLSTVWSQEGVPRLARPWEPWGRTLVTVVDASDPELEVVSRMTLEGSLAAARLTDGVVRLVLRSAPSDIPMTHPQGPSRADERRALRRNRAAIERSSLGAWLPEFVLEDVSSGRGVAARGRLVACDELYVPPEFGGFGTTTVVTIDPRLPAPGPAATVMADPQTVYASAGSLYVGTAAQAIEGPEPAGARPRVAAPTTELHRFDISSRSTVRYVSSGTVPGRLLNQWSLSEHRDHLRVATTLEGDRASESMVTVLAERGAALLPVGVVRGLGRGERIFAVRFVGDLGFVVTFRQVDPLYAIDLSRPRRPRVLGELKIPGFSVYLHPIGEGLILGLGRDATERGEVRGLQLSLFDASNLSAPRRIDRLDLGQGWSEAEEDHHAFLWWGRTGVAVLPVDRYDHAEQRSEAIVVRVSRTAGIERRGALAHRARPSPDDPWDARIRRALVIGERLYTMSEQGLLATHLDTLTSVGWLAWPAAD